MDINQGALITDTFKCPNPAFEASNMQLPYKVCIGRQIAKTPYGKLLYEPCVNCNDGKDIKKHFKDYKYVDKTVKINVRNATGKRVKKGESPYSRHYTGNINKTSSLLKGGYTPIAPPSTGEHTLNSPPLRGGPSISKTGGVGEGERMTAKQKRRCEVEGCPKGQWRERRCMVHFNEKHGIVKTGKLTKKKAKMMPPPESEKQIKTEPEVKKDNGKNLCLGQLLYASEMLDGQIESALDIGLVDTNILLNIRKRIGAVLRIDLPAEVKAP